MSEGKNISPFGNTGKSKEQLAEDRLLLYLEGKLSNAEQHEVEQWLAEEGMESDAVEGLQRINATEARHSVSKLNNRLSRNLGRKKHKRRRGFTNYYTLIAIGVVLMLAVIAYIVIRRSI